MNGKTMIQVIVGVALAGSAAAAFDALLATSAPPVTPIHGEAAAPSGTIAFLLPPLANRLVMNAGGLRGPSMAARNMMP